MNVRRFWGTGARYGGALAAVALAVAATFAIRRWMGWSVSILFFPAVITTAIYGGYGPALFATILSTASLAFIFIPPYYSLNIGPDDIIRWRCSPSSRSRPRC